MYQKLNWGNSRAYSQLSVDIAGLSKTPFFDHVAVLMQFVFADLADESSFRYENPHFLFGTEAPFDAVVSVHHFEKAAAMLGIAEVDVCNRSIDAFLASEVRARRYVLFVNRQFRSATFREGVTAALDRVQDSDRVEDVAFWDLRELLVESFRAMSDHFRREFAKRPSAPPPRLADGLPPVETVPVRLSSLLVDQHELRSESAPTTQVTDPTAALFSDSRVRDRAVVLGGFGYGKTTALQRALSTETGSSALLVPGSRIDNTVVGTKDLLIRFLDTDALLADVPVEWKALFFRLLRPVVEAAFKDPSFPASVIIDGIDESAFLDREGAIQDLFNCLWEIRVPVVLAMRTEYWQQHESSFRVAFGKKASHGERRVQEIRRIELLPWQRAQIASFLSRFREALDDDEAVAAIGQLETWLDDGRFEQFYGDVPKRPLFLRFIADTVAAKGLPEQRHGRARVIRDGIYHKIVRDVSAPREGGSPGRKPIREGADLEQVVALAWKAMRVASRTMTREHGEQLELLPTGRWETITTAEPSLEEIADLGALHLHTLLMPTEVRRGFRAETVEFAHRAFQEFFLAWDLIARGNDGRLGLPSEVEAWVEDLQNEALVERDEPWETQPTIEVIGADLTLQVSTEEGTHRSRLRYRLGRRNGGRGSWQEFGPVEVGVNLDALLRERINQLEYEALHGSTSLDLEALGASLGKAFLPRNLRRTLAELGTPTRSLHIVSDPRIPWEVIKLGHDDSSGHVTGPHLADAFRVTRGLEQGSLATYLPLTQVGLIIADNDSLPAAVDESATIKNLISPPRRAQGIEARLKPILDALAQGTYDGVHFAGHNQSQRDAEFSALSLDANESLNPYHLSDRAANLRLGAPLVFLNACRAAESSLTLAGVGGWATAFVEAGAGAFIAPTWKVRDRSASRFAGSFYRRFLAGESLTEAVHGARRELAPDDPTRLAYAAWGQPGARCTGDPRSAPPRRGT